MVTHETRLSTVRSHVQAFVDRGTPMSADFCQTGRADRSPGSSDSETCGSPPEVCSTAFNAQSPYPHPSLLKDVDFAVTGQLVRRHRPHVRLLSFGSRFCSSPPSVPPRDDAPALAHRSPPSSWKEDLHLQAINDGRRARIGRVSSGSMRRIIA